MIDFIGSFIGSWLGMVVVSGVGILVLIYGGIVLMWVLSAIFVVIAVAIMSLKPLWKFLNRIFKKVPLLFFPEILKRLQNLYQGFRNRYQWISWFGRYISWSDEVRYLLFDNDDVFDKILTISQSQQDFFYDHGYTDIKGRRVGQEIVCGHCITAEEIAGCKISDYILADESEKGVFCDRCKKQLPL